jgi:hypothetical protein
MIALVALVLVLAALGTFWRDVRPLVVRLVVVHERRYTMPQQKPAEPMPAHLEQMAMAWGSEFARDDALTAMREAYDELGDWSLVAARYGVFGGSMGGES